jgi:hypothetical protein
LLVGSSAFEVTVLETLERVDAMRAEVKSIGGKLEIIGAKVETIDIATQEVQFLRFNPWHELIATSIGKCNVSKETFAKTYGLSVPTISCMVSKIIPPPPASPHAPNLKLAHIMPRSTKLHILDSLGMGSEDVDDTKNLLILCSGLEIAFDKCQISFVPNSNPFAGGLELMFWKDEFKSNELYPGSGRTIGEFDKFTLDLNVNGHVHTIFRRALSYQAFISHQKWKRDIVNLSLPVNCDESEYKGSYKDTRENYLRQLAKDMEEEVGEDT